MAAFPRPHLLGLPRVEHGGFDDSERSVLGLDGRRVVDFSVSTNPFGPPPGVVEAFRAADITRYPDPHARPIRQAAAALHGVDPAQVLPGNGSVEIIWLVAAAYLEPGRRAVVLGPTFGEYAGASRAAGAHLTELRAAEEAGFRPDLSEIDAALVNSHPTVLFLCNPNNPTGVLLDGREVNDLSLRHPDTLCVVDEAYLPFVSGAESCLASALPENMLVLRSLTKDCAIPGLRLGYAVGSPEVVETLNAVQPPWSVNAAAQAAGAAALLASSHLSGCEEELARAHDYLSTALSGLGFRVAPTRANFLLVRTGDGAAYRRRLLHEGYCVRDCASFGLPEYVRIGVRTLRECEGLVAAITRAVQTTGASSPTSIPKVTPHAR